MDGANRYFYDSYAVLAYVSGRPNYRTYFEENDGILTKLNLLEIYYILLSVHGAKPARQTLKAFYKYLVDFSSDDIEESMKTRLGLKKKGLNISYSDALGYYLARKLGLRFLTGDRVFRGLANVQFEP